MAGKSSFAAWPCTIARSVGVVGDAWTLLILRESFFMMLFNDAGILHRHVPAAEIHHLRSHAAMDGIERRAFERRRRGHRQRPI